MNRAILTIKDLCVSIYDKVLYHNLNFTIYENDRYMFVGPNGSGKSLLLELIAVGYSNTLRQKYKGLTVTGEIIDDDGNNILLSSNRKKTNITFISQIELFYNNYTVKEQIETSCLAMNIDVSTNEIQNALSLFNTNINLNSKVSKSLSGGEGKIINLVSGILKLPKTKLLLLDEPLNHLSFENSKIFNRIINDYTEKNKDIAIVMVSHCKAINFVNKELRYMNGEFTKKTYKSYDCFE